MTTASATAQPVSTPSPDLVRLKDELAAAHRLTAHFQLNEGAWTHFSLAIPGAGGEMLMTPGDMHFSQIQPEHLLHLDPYGRKLAGVGAPNQSAWAIHEPMHRRCPQAVCILHAHSPFATAITMLEGMPFEPRASQNAATFFERTAWFREYTGVVQQIDEGDRLAAALGDKDVLLMENHGVIVAHRTVGDAFVRLYLLERACMTQVLSMQTGRPLKLVSEQAARHVADPANFESGAFEGLRKLV